MPLDVFGVTPSCAVAAAAATAGVPVVVARKMQQGSLLLGQMVSSADAAVTAAADGASFVLLQVLTCVHKQTDGRCGVGSLCCCLWLGVGAVTAQRWQIS